MRRTREKLSTEDHAPVLASPTHPISMAGGRRQVRRRDFHTDTVPTQAVSQQHLRTKRQKLAVSGSESESDHPASFEIPADSKCSKFEIGMLARGGLPKFNDEPSVHDRAQHESGLLGEQSNNLSALDFDRADRRTGNKQLSLQTVTRLPRTPTMA